MPTTIATKSNLLTFLGLWNEMLMELNKSYPATDTPTTKRNIEAFRELFLDYASGFMDGVTVLWSPDAKSPNYQGVMMAGSRGAQRLDYRWARPAWHHGIYVRPSYRHTDAWREMHDTMEAELKALGFTDIIGCVSVSNKPSYHIQRHAGGKPYAVLMERAL